MNRQQQADGADDVRLWPWNRPEKGAWTSRSHRAVVMAWLRTLATCRAGLGRWSISEQTKQGGFYPLQLLVLRVMDTQLEREFEVSRSFSLVECACPDLFAQGLDEMGAALDVMRKGGSVDLLRKNVAVRSGQHAQSGVAE